MCMRCGFYAISLAGKLAKECSGKLTKTGKYNILRWCRGQTPALDLEWPDPSPANAARQVIWKSRV